MYKPKEQKEPPKETVKPLGIHLKKQPTVNEFLVEKQSDLIWFEYETRLRKLVEELLEPTIRRSREERELFESLNKKSEALHKRVDDLEFMSQRTQKRQTAFDDIFKRINELVL